MRIDRNQFIKDLDAVKRHFSHVAKKDEIKRNYDQIDIIVGLYERLTGEKMDTDSLFLSKKFNLEQMQALDIIDRRDLIRYLSENIININTLFGNYDKYMRSIGFKQFPYSEYVQYYSEKQFIDIILSFYSQFGNEVYRAVKKYFDENRIEIGYKRTDKEDYPAAYADLPFLKTGYIISAHPNYYTWAISDMVHELGHAVDSETFLFPQDKKYSSLPDFLIEVPSMSYARCFSDYLFENDIDPLGALLLENYEQVKSLDRSSFTEEALKHKERKVDLEGVVHYEDKTTAPLRKVIIYGLGFHFANNLVNIYKQDPKEFQRILFNIISTRKETRLLEDSVAKMGVDFDDFLNCESIKNSVIESQGLLSLRFPGKRVYPDL